MLFRLTRTSTGLPGSNTCKGSTGYKDVGCEPGRLDQTARPAQSDLSSLLAYAISLIFSLLGV